MIKIKTHYGEYAVHYLNSPEKSKKTLVCLHGFLGSSETFEFLSNQEDYHVIAIDLMGHGLTEKSKCSDYYKLNSISKALEIIFDELSLEQIYLLGYSFGGRVAMHYAFHNPKRLQHLILESSSPGLATENERIERKKKDVKLANLLLSKGLDSFVDYWQELPLFSSQKLLPFDKIKKEISIKKKQKKEAMSLALEFGSVANQPNFLATNLFKKVPITYIAGRLDHKFATIALAIKKQTPCQVIMIENAGHCVHLEAPCFFSDIIYAILFDQSIVINDISAYEFDLELVTPFQTSYGRLLKKKTDIFALTTTKGTIGYGELLSFEQPDYIEETLASDRLTIKNYLVPLIKNITIYSPRQVRDLFKEVKGNEMAKSAIETAIWDIFAKNKNQSLQHYIGLDRREVSVGVSIGIQKSEQDLVNVVQKYVNEGYERIKLKINKGKDIPYIEAVRSSFPDLMIMVDANSAYHLSDTAHLKVFDRWNLILIEQPLASNDFINHATLQRQIKTPICLDENIRSLSDVKLAHQIGSCKSINLKISRVGGIAESLDILEYAKENKLTIWLGGMLESGVGRSVNIALASHPSLNLPGDISASSRYFKCDTIEEAFVLKRGKMIALTGSGIGVTLKLKGHSYQTKSY